jgi:Kunitz/Bovine pancreatic trypsin inhibitor domain
MTQLARLARFACAVSLVAILASACGGQSFAPDGGDAGSSGSAQGGSTSSGGTHSTGGKAHGGSQTGGSNTGATSPGGTGVGGTGSGGGVTAGAGGTGNDECNGPPVNGPEMCDAYIPAWTHDSTTGLCRPYVYGGCGGTKNLYKTLAECQTACPGGNPNYDACKLPTDCALVGQGCCGVCDGPNVTAHDFISYNKQYAAQVTPCANVDIACGACPPTAPGQGSMKYFVPNCVQGQCVVEDLRTSAVTACKSNSECQLRNGNGCCPACNIDAPIAVRNDGSFENLVCGNLRPPCAACMPASNGAIAVCGQSGHCEVEYAVAADQAP